ncbi:hypothetical protein, partial [Escherichia coli]
DRNRSHWSTSKTPSYTKSVSWQHHPLRIENTQKLSPEIFLSTPQQLEEIKNHWTSSIFCSFFAQQ